MPPKQGTHKKADKPIGDMSEPDGFGVLGGRFLEWLAVRNYSAMTISNRRSYLRLFVEWCSERALAKPIDVTKPILERYQRHLFYFRRPNGTPLSFRAQNARLIALKAFFRWLGRENLIPANPASDLELPRLPQRLPPAVLSHAEVEQVLAQPDVATLVGVRDRAILEVLYSTGMRRFELVRLRVFDVDKERHTIHIVEGKGKKDRIVPIGEGALAWVHRYLEDVRPRLVGATDDGTLFLTGLGDGLNRDWLSQLARGYIQAADIGKSGACHLLRHSMATAMLEGGADVRYIQEMLGHAHLDSTAIYTRVGIRALQAVHQATHPGCKKEPQSAAKTANKRAAQELFSALQAEAEEDGDGAEGEENEAEDDVSDSS